MNRTSTRPYDERDKMHRSSKRDFDYDRYGDRSRERDRSRDRRSRSRDRGYSKYHRDRSPYARGGNGRRDRRDSRSKERSRGYRNERSERDRSRDGRRNDRDAGKRLPEKRSRSTERLRDVKGTPRSRSRSPAERKSENLAHFGDWRQHISSSGKTFYYNSITEVSQWEKPKEWLEWEKQKESKENTPPPLVAQVVKVVEDASPVSEDSPISSSDEEDEGQTPETREPDETVLETSPQKPQFLPGSIPSREQVLQETSPLSEDDDDDNRSPSATSSQADQTPPRPDSKTGQASTSQTTTLLPPPVKPMTLSPSLAAYYNEVLIAHMTQWQADHIERQAERLQKELFTIGSVHSSSISADLKMARSMVRLAEIQATLQEQRALFLQQQIAQLEDKAFVTSQSSNGA